MRVHQCTLSFLSSGHSHEDIDGLFSVYASWLDRYGDLLTPFDFQTALERLMGKEGHRPYERLKKVAIMSQFRDWILSTMIFFMPLHVTHWECMVTRLLNFVYL